MALTDFHNHLIPSVDDGAQDAEQARTGLQAFYDVGVRTIVATPHFDGSLVHDPAELEGRLAELDAGWGRLRGLAAEGFPHIDLHRGVEFRLETPEPDLSDARLRLGGGPFALVEFAFFMVPPRSEEVLSRIVRDGWTPIVAHPERYRGMENAWEVAELWRRAGAYLQVNAGSILGRYGAEAQKAADALLDKGWVDYVASDFHSRGDPLLGSAAELLDELCGEERRSLLMDVNARRMLRGDAPLPVGPVQRGGSGGLRGLLRKFRSRP